MRYCPKCEGDSVVRDSRVVMTGDVKRSRVCETCGNKWFTVEVEEQELARLRVVELALKGFGGTLRRYLKED